MGMEVMESLMARYPDLKDASIGQLIGALKGAGIERKVIEKAAKTVAEATKRNKRIGRSLETLIKFE